MTLIYFFITLSAIMIISNSLFYRIGVVNSRRRIQNYGLGSIEYVPSLLGLDQTYQKQNSGFNFNVIAPSAISIKSTNTISKENNTPVNSNKSTSIGYKPVTSRMTIVYTINN